MTLRDALCFQEAQAPGSSHLIRAQTLEKWFLAQLELQKRFDITRGCPFGTIGNEVTGNDELVRQDLSLIFEVIKNKLAAFFVQEKSRGRRGRVADPVRMADFCIATIQGGMLLGKINRNSEAVVREALAHLRHYGARSSG